MVKHWIMAGALCAAFALGNTKPAGAAVQDTPTSFPLWSPVIPGALGTQDKDIPALTPYLAPADVATGAAIVVCPGGGYAGLATEHEGHRYARWLNSLGISAFVLKYRLGTAGYRHPVMLNDVSRAIRIVRARAGEWHIDPDRVGVMGSSAGGHLASSLLTHYDSGDASSSDTIERQSSRPSLGILCYPVITMQKHAHAGSRKNLLGENPSPELVKFMSSEEQVTSATPPTFIVHTADDKVVPVENALMFATALSAADVPYELHVYPHGAHGMGLGGGRQGIEGQHHPWVASCTAWLKEQGFARK